MPRDRLDNNHRIEIIESVKNISESDWNKCLNSDHPFMKHAFLWALEESGSATQATGWLAQHLVLKQEDNIVGIMPLYLKNHSAGEYVFDHGWADAFSRAGGQYYPKLQASVPFTPVTGPRILISPEVKTPNKAKKSLIHAAIARCSELGASSLHVTFPTESESIIFEEEGLLQRTGLQFHWKNNNYNNFNDFLSSLSSSKRKQIRRERRDCSEQGLIISTLSGSEIKEHHWDSFFAFYQNTINHKWGNPYLTRQFFSLIGTNMAEQIVLILANDGSKPIAGALNMIGDKTIYGRNWGCIEEKKFLHFEVCYYQAIDFAISNGLLRVEAGAQGTHKLSRGYLPTTTYSAHWIAHTGFRDAVGEYLSKEINLIDSEIEHLFQQSPYRKV